MTWRKERLREEILAPFISLKRVCDLICDLICDLTVAIVLIEGKLTLLSGWLGLV